MSQKPGKKYEAAAKQVEAKPYQLPEAVNLVQKIKFTKFDETVEVHLRLGVDPKHADQMVRGTVVLPNGLGRSKRVLVITSGDKLREAQEAGADLVGGEEMVTRIQTENWTDYDAVIATPDMMRSVGRLGKVLGPRGSDAQPEDRDRNDRCQNGGTGNQSRQGRVSRRQDGRDSCPCRQG